MHCFVHVKFALPSKTFITRCSVAGKHPATTVGSMHQKTTLKIHPLRLRLVTISATERRLIVCGMDMHVPSEVTLLVRPIATFATGKTFHIKMHGFVHVNLVLRFKSFLAFRVLAGESLAGVAGVH